MRQTLYYLLGIVLLSCLLLSCSSNDVQQHYELEEADITSQEDYDIYSLILSELNTSKQIVISQETKTNIALEPGNKHSEHLIQNNPSVEPLLVNDFVNSNAKTYKLADKIVVKNKEVVIITAEELDDLSDGDDVNGFWEGFYTRYKSSNGIYRFSRIAYGVYRNQAVLEMSHSYASLGAEEVIVFLLKVDGQWQITDKLPSRVS